MPAPAEMLKRPAAEQVSEVVNLIEVKDEQGGECKHTNGDVAGKVWLRQVDMPVKLRDGIKMSDDEMDRWILFLDSTLF